MRLTRRAKRALGGLVAAGLLAVGLVAIFGGPPVDIPDDPCVTTPALVAYRGIRLQPPAMEAFREAEATAGRPIPVVQSYRSCSEQAEACERICGNRQGCPGTCVRPGRSYHQLGAAIDVDGAALRDERVVRALEEAGWCQPLPGSDPGHWSFGGCH